MGERVLLKVSPKKGVVWFGAKGKLSPRYIGPYEIVEWISTLAYRLALPNSLEKVHDVFQVSQLNRYIAATTYGLDPESLELDSTLNYEEMPFCILDTKIRSTRRKDITMVKALWSNHERGAVTWETKSSMREKYPLLFQVSKFRRPYFF